MNDVPELSSNDRPLDESSSDDEPLSFEQPLCERPPLREPGRVLRDLADQGTLLVPGAFNALTGMLIQQSGFPATYLSGAACSAGTLGLPDVGLVTLSELAWQTAILARRLTIPILVDADTGFGGVVNVERTVVEPPFNWKINNYPNGAVISVASGWSAVQRWLPSCRQRAELAVIRTR